MTMADGSSGHGKMRLTSVTSRYHDIHKGAMEDARPTEAKTARRASATDAALPHLDVEPARQGASCCRSGFNLDNAFRPTVSSGPAHLPTAARPISKR